MSIVILPSNLCFCYCQWKRVWSRNNDIVKEIWFGSLAPAMATCYLHYCQKLKYFMWVLSWYMSENLAFKDSFQVFFINKAVIAGVHASRTVLKICWRSFLEYFSIKKEVIKRLGEVEDLRRVKISRAGLGSSRPGSEVERSSIFLELLCSLDRAIGESYKSSVLTEILLI